MVRYIDELGEHGTTGTGARHVTGQKLRIVAVTGVRSTYRLTIIYTLRECLKGVDTGQLPTRSKEAGDEGSSRRDRINTGQAFYRGRINLGTD